MRKLIPLSIVTAFLFTSLAADAQNFGLFINPIEERIIGEQAHNRRLATTVVQYPDPKLKNYIEVIGRSAARKRARFPEKFVFTLVNTTNPNAYASLGGFIYFHTGMFLWINDEAELASVMAHEVGHAVNRHVARTMNRDNVSKSLIKLRLLRRRNPQEFKELQIKAALALKSYGRDQEFEADAVATGLLGKMGYDPYGAARMNYQLHLIGLYSSKVNGTPNSTPLAWRTHPPSMDRVRRSLDQAKSQNYGDLPRYKKRYQNMINGLRLDLSDYGGPKQGYLRIYTVQEGENAQMISRRIPVRKPLDFLLATNGFDTADEMKPGMSIKIVSRR